MHHIELYVSDLEAAIKSFKMEFRHQLEERSLLPCDCSGKRRMSRAEISQVPCRPEPSRVSAEIKLQVDLMTEKLMAKGYRVLYRDRHPFAGGDGHYAVYCEDPDRIKVELVAPSG